MKFLFCILFFFFAANGIAQQIYLPLGRDYLIPFDQSLNTLSSNFHTSIKPYLQSKIITYDSLTDYHLSYATFIDSKKRNWFWRKLFREHFVSLKSNEFEMHIDPLMNIQLGKNFSDTTGGLLYTNTRAVSVQGHIGKQFSYYTDFYENQSVFLPHISNFIQSNPTAMVAPGEGWVKPFKTNGFDYAMASGYVSYTPDKHIHFQFGHGKNFIGDGYRSLLLSDNSFNYPFLKITSNFRKFQYTNLFCSFMDLQAPHAYEMGYKKKLGSFHYLSWIATKRIHVGFFEGIIWQTSDSSSSKSFDMNYLNPILFFRPIQFSLSSSNNALVGATMKIKILNNFFTYGQLVIDDINLYAAKQDRGYLQNKNGFQLGLRWFDLFIKNLNLQLEYNQLRPYTYAHKESTQSYTHYNQALAHPLGANFYEALGFIQYRYKNVFVELKSSYAVYGADTNGSHWGKNVFLSDNDAQKGFYSYGNAIAQGVKTTLTYKDIRVAYLINPVTNLNIIAGFSNRIQTSSIETQNSNYLYFGIATNLTNRYYDF